MTRYVTYVHGETNLALRVVANCNKNGDVELIAVLHKGENILPLLGEDITVNIELYCGNLFILTDEN